MALTGIGVTPGLFHCIPEALGTLTGREMEQVRETVAPDIMGVGGEDVSKMVAGTIHVKNEIYSNGNNLRSSIPIKVSGPRDLELDSVLESADTLTEKVAPAISPVMSTLVSVSTAFTEPFCLPSICW